MYVKITEIRDPSTNKLVGKFYERERRLELKIDKERFANIHFSEDSHFYIDYHDSRTKPNT